MNWINSLKLIQNPNPGYASFRQLNNIWEFKIQLIPCNWSTYRTYLHVFDCYGNFDGT